MPLRIEPVRSGKRLAHLISDAKLPNRHDREARRGGSLFLIRNIILPLVDRRDLLLDDTYDPGALELVEHEVLIAIDRLRASDAGSISGISDYLRANPSPRRGSDVDTWLAYLKPIENAIPMITGTLTSEFFDRTEFYDKFRTGATVPMQLDFSHFDAAGNDANGVASGPNPYLLSFIMPAVKFKSAAQNITSPDVIPQSVGFQCYDDGTTNPVLQVKLVSKESSSL